MVACPILNSSQNGFSSVVPLIVFWQCGSCRVGWEIRREDDACYQGSSYPGISQCGARILRSHAHTLGTSNVCMYLP